MSYMFFERAQRKAWQQIDTAKKSSSEIIPPDWGTYAKTIICTHGGKHGYRGKGKRPRPEARPMGCMTQINVCVQLVSESPSKFAVCVTKTALTHNHKLGLRSYKHYPANRMSVNGEVPETVDSLRKAGAKMKSILKFIVENSDSNPTPQDVQNLIRNLKKREQGGMTHSYRIKKWMLAFCAVPGNLGRIFVDSSNEKRIATCITLQTKHMVAIFNRFPEVLMVDATHGTNYSKYTISSFMAHDVFGTIRSTRCHSERAR
ncbi:hypothetical protein F442_21052 [Phytophthora nicotianae P10297]|uniref:ZSWIM1/3 RNaseH-like domain-containing protein n=5 Tax=Phytophthora nicotianae TaxID=4792 RepID=V9DYY3_PHYNI|nr:hypothetical protein F443_21227 [Phytophthora nicotianae P1569]ETP29854.1 hypothetical protein F442_21052 [Phytophthora nicotianae P10297]